MMRLPRLLLPLKDPVVEPSSTLLAPPLPGLPLALTPVVLPSPTMDTCGLLSGGPPMLPLVTPTATGALVSLPSC